MKETSITNREDNLVEEEEKFIKRIEDVLSSEINKNGYAQVLPLRYGSIPDENCYWCIHGGAKNAKKCPPEKQKAFEVIVGAKWWIKTTGPTAIQCRLTEEFMFPYDYCDNFEKKVSHGHESFLPASIVMKEKNKCQT